MTRAVLLAGLVVMTIASPTLSQTTTPIETPQFYIVQNLQTKKCSIVEEKPTSTNVSIVGSSTYKTRAEAEAGMKASVICSMT